MDFQEKSNNSLIDYVIELCEKIDYLDEKLNNKIEV